jgi:hypothetical protein
MVRQVEYCYSALGKESLIALMLIFEAPAGKGSAWEQVAARFTAAV